MGKKLGYIALSVLVFLLCCTIGGGDGGVKDHGKGKGGVEGKSPNDTSHGGSNKDNDKGGHGGSYEGGATAAGCGGCGNEGTAGRGGTNNEGFGGNNGGGGEGGTRGEGQVDDEKKGSGSGNGGCVIGGSGLVSICGTGVLFSVVILVLGLLCLGICCYHKSGVAAGTCKETDVV